MGRIHRRWGELADTDEERLSARGEAAVPGGLFHSPAFHAHERGEIDDGEFFDAARRILHLTLTDAQMLDGWNSIFLGEMAGIRAILARVRGRIPLYVLSNTNPAHQAHWSRTYADLLAPFDHLFTSNELGARKPEPAAFASVLARMGQPADLVLFFDDVLDNVPAARSFGLLAEQATSTSDIAHAITPVRP